MEIKIKPNTYIFFGLLILLMPIRWLIAWMFSVAFHEFCHWLTVRLLGGEVYTLTIAVGGANMECSMLSKNKQLLAILSGPVGGCLPVLLGSVFPRVAICCWVLSVYNLLPLLPLDGGKALHTLCNECAFLTVQKLVLVILILGGFYSLFCLQLGAIPLLIAVGLWVKNRKSPCKETVCKVQ